MGRARARAAWFEALGNSHRIGLILALAGGEETSGVLAVAVGLTRYGASHHLTALRRAGSVAAARHKRFVRYRLVGALVTPAAVELIHPSGVRIAFDRAAR